MYLKYSLSNSLKKLSLILIYFLCLNEENTILLLFIKRANFIKLQFVTWKRIGCCTSQISAFARHEFFVLCTVGQKKKKKRKERKRSTPIYFNTNYRTEMKLVPIIMNYRLIHFDALELFLGVRLHRRVSI